MRDRKLNVKISTEAQRLSSDSQSYRTQDSETASLNSHEEGNSNKLEEDVRFPMEQHLMQAGPQPRLEELDALRHVSESSKSNRLYTLTTELHHSVIEATSLSSLVAKEKSLPSLLDGGNGIWWLDCHNPSTEELRALAKTFDIHPLTIEDVLSTDPLEKFEMMRNYAFVAYKTFVFDAETDEYKPVKFYIIVFRGGIISIHAGPNTDHTERVRHRMRKIQDWVKVSAVWVCYALLDDITDSFNSVLKTIESEAAYVEHAVFIDNGTSEIAVLLGRLGQVRQKVMSMVRFLYGKNDVVRGFIEAGSKNTDDVVSSEIGLYLGDIRNRLDTMKENLVSYESILSRAHNSFMGILQVQYVNSNTRMTTLLGKVTIIATVLVPMNLVFGAWGMNVPVPGQDSTGLGWFFGIVGTICAVVIVVAILAWWYFKKVLYTKRGQSFV